MVAPVLIGIFGKGEIQVPMLVTFNPSVLAHVASSGSGLGQRREKAVGGLFFVSIEPARGLHADHHSQPGPTGSRIHWAQVLAALSPPPAPVAFVQMLVGRRLGEQENKMRYHQGV